MVGKRMFNVVDMNMTPGVPPLCRCYSRGVGTVNRFDCSLFVHSRFVTPRSSLQTIASIALLC